MHQRRDLNLAKLAIIAWLLSACGGGSGSGDDGKLQLPPPPADVSVTTDLAYSNLPAFAQPVALMQAPGDDRWYVVERAGRVHAFADDVLADAISPVLDITDRVNSGAGERGFLGLAFSPSYAVDRQAYLSYTRDDGASVLSRVSSTDGGQTLDADTEEILITVAQPATNHNGGNLAFGPDGFLYWGLGDGGGGNDPGDNAQNTQNLLGAMLRIDVNSAAQPYAIPAGNPFSGNALCAQGVGGADCPEIFAWGLRNPWRWSFDEQSGLLWAGDVGQGAWEEVDVVSAGNNYGWRDREGAHCNPTLYPNDNCPTLNLVDPVAEYGRSLGQSITGGYVYRGSEIAGLDGDYVYGDFVSGRLFRYSGPASGGGLAEEILDTSLNIASFAQTAAGELLILDYGSGRIYSLAADP